MAEERKKHYLICYDIRDQKRLKKIARVMEDYGVRVLYSVFECYLSEMEFLELKTKVEEIMDIEDSVIYYPLCKSCARPIAHLGYGKHKKIQKEKEFEII